MEQPNVIIAEGYDSIKSEDGETGFGIYDPENKQIFIAGAVPDEIFVKALLHELMHWVQDISGCAFNEDEANTFAENIYNTMEPYIVARRWTPCSDGLPKVDESVLATTVWNDVTIAWRIGINEWFIHDGGTNATTEDLIAWMPLPEPWKGADDEVD